MGRSLRIIFLLPLFIVLAGVLILIVRNDSEPFPIEESVTCTVFDGGEYIRIQNHMRNLHIARSGFTGDGMLFFAGLEQYVKNEKLPEFEYCPEFRIETSFDDRLSTIKESTTVYGVSGDELKKVEEFEGFDRLPPGKYLIDFQFDVYRRDDYYSGNALFRLIVNQPES